MNKNQIIISINAEKASKVINYVINKYHPFITSQQSGIEGTYLNIIKAVNDKPAANIILKGEKLKESPLRSGMRQGCPLSPVLFNKGSDVLDTAIRQEKEMKDTQTGKEEVKLSLLGDNTILYKEDPKDATKNY